MVKVRASESEWELKLEWGGKKGDVDREGESKRIYGWLM